jgi:type II secretory pathway pseudopilin PulG
MTRSPDGRRPGRLRDDDRAPAPVGSTLRDDDRGVSTALGYVLSLAIASILISGLMIAAAGYVQSEREQVVRSELNVIGQTLIADLEGADRLASSIDGEVTVRSSLPRRVGSSAYSIEIRNDTYNGLSGDPREMVLSAASVDVSVRFHVVTNTTLDADGATADGGELVIEYDSGTGELEVIDA